MESFWLDKKTDWVKLVKEMAVRAGSNSGEPKFRALSSGIPLRKAELKLPQLILIDIGGTSTKVGIRRLESGKEVWAVLMEEPNDSFDDSSHQGSNLERFASAVAERTKEALSKNALNKEGPWGLGIVWSNAMDNPVIPGFGIEGVVSGREHYYKGEWFCRDVKNGDKIGVVFAQAFGHGGLKINLTLVGNDTPLTMKAWPTASAGMVASTGLNATIVKNSSSGPIICNAEMGTTWKVDTSLVGEADLIGPGFKAGIIEHLVSGQNLPKLFVSHVLYNSGKEKSLKNLAERFKVLGSKAYEMLPAADLAACLNSPAQFANKLELSSEELKSCSSIVERLIVRAARLSALLAFASVVEQLDGNSSVEVALDSSLSRGIPLFWSELNKSVQEISPPGKTIKLKLVDRIPVDGGILSVPMQGAANALDSLAEALK